VHDEEDDASEPVRMLNIHAPAGFDHRIGLENSEDGSNAS
jgi:hypothetical protein